MLREKLTTLLRKKFPKWDAKKLKREVSRRLGGNDKPEDASAIPINDLLLPDGASYVQYNVDIDDGSVDVTDVLYMDNNGNVVGRPTEIEPSGVTDSAESSVVDDLTKISGIGKKIAGKLNDAGITTFAQLAALTDDEIANIDESLSFKGRIGRENWVGQAADLIKNRLA